MSKEDNFIGSTFPTKKGGTLTVRNRCGKKYICTCTLCDNLPFISFGSILASKKDLLKGKIPCFCTPVPKISENTMWYIAKQRVESLGFCFLSFTEEYHGVGTKVKMLDPKSGDISDTVSINNLDKIVGFPTSRYKRTSASNTPSLEEVQNIVDKFIHGVVATEEDGVRYLICPVCKSLGYKGKYRLYSRHLRNRKSPCPCHSDKLCLYDKKIKLTKKCEEYGSTFVNLSPTNKVEFICKNNHFCNSTSASCLLYSKSNCCKQCYIESKRWNYYKDRLEDDDYLYLMEIEYEGILYLKIGKSFNPIKRANKIKLQEGISSITILDTIRAKHKDIYTKEIEVHKELRQYSCNLPIEGGSEFYPKTNTINNYYKEVKLCLLGLQES